jgi:hypothetical protein
VLPHLPQDTTNSSSSSSSSSATGRCQSALDAYATNSKSDATAGQPATNAEQAVPLVLTPMQVWRYCHGAGASIMRTVMQHLFHQSYAASLCIVSIETQHDPARQPLPHTANKRMNTEAKFPSTVFVCLMLRPLSHCA